MTQSSPPTCSWRPGDSEALARHMVAENAKWKKVIEAAGLEKQ